MNDVNRKGGAGRQMPGNASFVSQEVIPAGVGASWESGTGGRTSFTPSGFGKIVCASFSTGFAFSPAANLLHPWLDSLTPSGVGEVVAFVGMVGMDA